MEEVNEDSVLAAFRCSLAFPAPVSSLAAAFLSLSKS